jgi:hypothetical protein
MATAANVFVLFFVFITNRIVLLYFDALVRSGFI